MKVFAIATVTLEIPLSQSWSEECTMKEIDRAAKAQVVDELRRGLCVSSLINSNAQTEAERIGRRLTVGTVINTEIKKVIVKE